MSLVVDWRDLKRVCERLGWREDRTRGGHLVMTKESAHRPVVIPKHGRSLAPGVLASNLRTMGIDRSRFEGLLNEVRRKGRMGGKKRSSKDGKQKR